MNNKVFISCAVTGSGDTASKHPDLPKTPEQIATASIEAAKAGAAIAHIHVREEDGTPSRRLELYKEVIDRVRSSDTDVILNLTTGMGGDLDIGQGKNPLDFAISQTFLDASTPRWLIFFFAIFFKKIPSLEPISTTNDLVFSFDFFIIFFDNLFQCFFITLDVDAR